MIESPAPRLPEYRATSTPAATAATAITAAVTAKPSRLRPGRSGDTAGTGGSSAAMTVSTASPGRSGASAGSAGTALLGSSAVTVSSPAGATRSRSMLGRSRGSSVVSASSPVSATAAVRRRWNITVRGARRPYPGGDGQDPHQAGDSGAGGVVVDVGVVGGHQLVADVAVAAALVDPDTDLAADLAGHGHVALGHGLARAHRAGEVLGQGGGPGRRWCGAVRGRRPHKARRRRPPRPPRSKPKPVGSRSAPAYGCSRSATFIRLAGGGPSLARS